jgi:quinolinate synthase
MAMNSLQGLAAVLESGANRIEVDGALIERARLPIDRMLAFTASKAGGSQSVSPASGIVPHIGAA